LFGWDKMKREDGYYWVRLKGCFNGWQPAQWSRDVWWTLGCEIDYDDENIIEVGEKIIKK